MSGINQISKLLTNSALKSTVWYCRKHSQQIRLLSYVSKEYDEKNSPAPHFFNEKIQNLLLSLTRTDLQKVFQKRTVGSLEDPRFEFLTDKQLKEKLDEIRKVALKHLQFPPAVPVRTPKDKVFSRDPALKGYDTSKFVFTDISFGIKDNDRIIAVRDTDGTLQEADWKTRDRMNQVYFPKTHRQLKVPHLFNDSYFEDVLNNREYVFILDLACQQFEPDDPEYQRIASITYQHINDNNAFDKLRSTRHFGSMTFFLVWNKMIDNLLLDLIDSCYLNEASELIELYYSVHNIQVDNIGNIELIGDFLKNHSNKQAILELAFQATKDFLKKKEETVEGIRKAHGH
ncbi:hypothetical protein WA026_006621 [Henosepilachna vigintioctopunctata]|uniref:28S ribosomal protein S22, mitochondrial n=1 Tax=Henosepilachna vigintioctopunctata TaxID=420089 RepID=A0AAW1UEH6_9CUCU